MTRGKFITFEGIDGIGKSTQVDALCAWLKGRGKAVIKTREPGGVPAAEAVRELLLDTHDIRNPLAETLLLFAARAEHLAQVIRPALAAGQWVVCDRFTDSTFAYQGGGRGVASEFIAHLATTIHGDCNPDLTFYLTPTAKLQHSLLDSFESQDGEFHARVKAAYQNLTQQHPQRIVAVSRPQPTATSPAAETALSVAKSVKIMAEEIQQHITDRFGV